MLNNFHDCSASSSHNRLCTSSISTPPHCPSANQPCSQSTLLHTFHPHAFIQLTHHSGRHFQTLAPSQSIISQLKPHTPFNASIASSMLVVGESALSGLWSHLVNPLHFQFCLQLQNGSIVMAIATLGHGTPLAPRRVMHSHQEDRHESTCTGRKKAPKEHYLITNST